MFMAQEENNLMHMQNEPLGHIHTVNYHMLKFGNDSFEHILEPIPTIAQCCSTIPFSPQTVFVVLPLSVFCTNPVKLSVSSSLR